MLPLVPNVAGNTAINVYIFANIRNSKILYDLSHFNLYNQSFYSKDGCKRKIMLNLYDKIVPRNISVVY